jgi:prepilin peptidase CpaA
VIPLPIIAATLAFIVVCMAIDIRTRRIPNYLSGLGIVAGGALNAYYFGGDGLLTSAAGLVVTMAALLVPFALGGLGGGDVKMMGAVGALVGLQTALPALLAGLMFGGVIMAIHLARLGRLRQTVATVGTMATSSVLGGSLEPLRVSATQPGVITLPYSVPLGLGTLVVLALGGVA